MSPRIVLLLGILLVAGCTPVPAAPSASSSPTAAAPSPSPFSPTVAASPTAACTEAEGRWIDYRYQGVAVAGEVPARIYLPPCYEQDPGRYPVAYFLHGKPYTESEWFDLGLPGLVSEAVRRGELPPTILVLARQPEPLFSGSDGGDGSYETEFIDGLVAAVDRSFRTETHAEGRAIVGISRGGVWALEIALRHPDLVASVAALSPALAVNHARDPYDPLKLAAAAPVLPERFLLASGDSDWARKGTEDMAGTLESRGVTPEKVVVAGGHSDPTWEGLLPVVLDFLARAFGQA